MRHIGPTRFCVTAAIATMFVSAHAVHADLIEARFDRIQPGRAIQLSTDSGQSWMNVPVGVHLWTRIGGDSSGEGAGGSFSTFAIDIGPPARRRSGYDFAVLPPAEAPLSGSAMGADRADVLSELFGRFYRSDFNPQEAAAFQTAIWEIVHDDRNLAAGDLRFKNAGAYYDIAQGWLDSLDRTGPRTPLLAMSSPVARDHILAVPTPASAALVGLAGLCASMRSRRTRAT